MADLNGSCGTNATYSFIESTGVLTISGTGAMSDYSSGSAPWYANLRYKVTKIIIEDGITRIGNYAFASTSNNGSTCTELIISNSVTSIGKNAFAYLPNVTSPLELRNVTTVGEYAFAGCSNIPSVTFGANLSNVNAYAFNDCFAIKTITFRGEKPTLAKYSFMIGSSKNRVTITLYSKGWASDSVFTSGSSGIRGPYTTFIYEILKGSTIPVNVRGIWKGSTPFAKVKGVWKEVTAWCKDNGVWHKIGGDYEGYTGLAVFFDANGGEGDMSPILTESSATIPSNAFTRDKYRFSGWNTSPDGSGTTYSAGQTITITSNVTLYAMWVAVFTVSFNANGGSGSIAAIQTEGALTIPSNAFTLSGYAFNGWNTSPDGTGTAYSAGQSLTVTSDLTLYAVWIRQYTVSFNANGGTGTVASIVTTGTTVTLPANGFTRSGRVFGEWNTASDRSGTSYSEGQTITISSDVTIYAIWKYTISYYKSFNVGYQSSWGSPTNYNGSVTDDSGNYYYLMLAVSGSIVPGLLDSFQSNKVSPTHSVTAYEGDVFFIQLITKRGTAAVNEIYIDGTRVAGPAQVITWYKDNGVTSNMSIKFEWHTKGSILYTTDYYWICRITTS